VTVQLTLETQLNAISANNVSRLAHVNMRGYVAVKGGVYEGMGEIRMGNGDACTYVFTRTKLPLVVILEPAKQI
jgi:hypothetical protein